MAGRVFRDHREEGWPEVLEAGAFAGRIAYFTLDFAPAPLVAVHVVEPGDEDKGIGSAVVREFHATAAHDGLRAVTLCPQAAAWVLHHPDEVPTAPSELVHEAERQLKQHPRP
ncbi:N-acetyltransferase [Streptomyces sp. NPDC059176]|uniref:N-acetyltransferase n=1 Tax=unclassified Streptomyces TaxID=2593676 RepID=UPI0036840136